MVLLALVITTKLTFTVVALVQVHDVSDALVKTNRSLHFQDVLKMFAESVGEPKVIRTSCPLSEN